MPDPTPLVQTLIREQERLKLTNRGMAARLGISTQLWYKVKNGGRQPSRFLLQAVTKAFPHLQGRVLDYLATSGAIQEQQAS